jgi:hypothetical protein
VLFLSNGISKISSGRFSIDWITCIHTTYDIFSTFKNNTLCTQRWTFSIPVDGPKSTTQHCLSSIRWASSPFSDWTNSPYWALSRKHERFHHLLVEQYLLLLTMHLIQNLIIVVIAEISAGLISAILIYL